MTNMNEYISKKIRAFMRMLKKLGLNKEQICGIASLVLEEKETTLQEIVNKLESKNFKTTPQETMNICVQTIMTHSDK